MEEAVNHWINTNPVSFERILAVTALAFGICLIIGAFKNWNWLYQQDKSYQNNWSMGQIIRYFGRKNAHIIYFFGGIFMFCIGLFLCYAAFIVKK